MQYLRFSAQHGTQSCVRAEVSKHFEERYFIPPCVVVHQCALPDPLLLISMSFTISLYTRAQLLQLHMHTRHIGFSNRRVYLLSAF